MPEARASGAAVLLEDRSVLIVGGHRWEDAGDEGMDQVIPTSAIRFVPAH
jgi:hypothetical protein